MSAILIMCAAYLVSMLVVSLSLMLAGWWLNFPRKGFWPAILTVLLWTIVGSGLLAWSLCLQGKIVGTTRIVMMLGFLLLQVVAEWGIIRIVQRASVWRAAAGWGIALISRGITLVLMLVVVRGWLVESYKIPTMSMMPTLMPDYRTTVCPKCGGELVFQGLEFTVVTHPPVGFCLNCHETIWLEGERLSKGIEGDHFFVTKIISPRRWDLVTYRRGGQIYVGRLVASGGEEIAIDSDGVVWINGNREAGSPESPTFRWPKDFSKYSPWAIQPGEKKKLGTEEVFVLGDCPEFAFDSRRFGPLAKTDIDGVVSWIYSPVARMRILR